MHIYFSGIGGAGLGPLAVIAKQAGFTVSGSDKQDSAYINYLKNHGITNISIGQQNKEAIQSTHNTNPIDWFVYTTAVTSEQSNPPEMEFCEEHGIKISKRDELLNEILKQKNLSMVAVAGTHGKTTTTAMVVWLFEQLGIPVSYSAGAKLSTGEMGAYTEGSKYFVYEADEYARNFLSFSPEISIITGVDWDHPDIYPTQQDYNQAFVDFYKQSGYTIFWQSDARKLAVFKNEHTLVLPDDSEMLSAITLPGEVNRRDALQAVKALQQVTDTPVSKLVELVNTFPGVSRRFEKISTNLYSDYAHTPPKIRGAIQLAHEVAGDNVVVVYEGLHNTRQHFIKDELANIFGSVKKLYIVPSYLAREDPNLPILSPADLKEIMLSPDPDKITPSACNEDLRQSIKSHTSQGDLVICLTAGGGGSLDGWLREQFS